MPRFAGLWTGDIGRSWDFWRISVAQILALGYSGLSIAGVDKRGFTIDPAQAKLRRRTGVIPSCSSGGIRDLSYCLGIAIIIISTST